MLHIPSPLGLLRRLRRQRTAQVAAQPPEPLDHPALRRMSSRELADLPMPRPAGPELLLPSMARSTPDA